MPGSELASDAPSRMSLQDIVDQLAVALDRQVFVRDVEHSFEIRSGPAAGRPEPSSMPAGRDARTLLQVPVEGERGTVGEVVVLGEASTLEPELLDALDAGVALVRDAWAVRSPVASLDRETTMAQLLHDDVTVRRVAFALSLERRWLQRASGATLRAVLIDASVGAVQCHAFARHLARLRPIPLFFVRLRYGVMYVVGPPSDDTLDERIVAEAAARGIRVLGIGSAAPARTAEDLWDAAEQATTAANLSASFAEFQPAVDVDQLGGWLLLSSAQIDPAHLHAISPAAAHLAAHGDESQRRTVETYLDVGANVVAACEVLFIHRTTLYYRLEKMPEVVREALADGMKRSTLHLALKLIRLWEASGRI